MFSYISGRLAEKNLNYAVVDVGGIGFKIYTSLTTLNDVSEEVNSKVTFYTYMYIKEGIMDLYGFSTKTELELFEMLISVSGVGAKGAAAVLSVAPTEKIALAIASGDTSVIKKAAGIGAKTAQRICLELKDKVKNESFISGNTDAFEALEQISFADEKTEAVAALCALGYSAQDAKRAVSQLDPALNKVEQIVKAALKKLM